MFCRTREVPIPQIAPCLVQPLQIPGSRVLFVMQALVCTNPALPRDPSSRSLGQGRAPVGPSRPAGCRCWGVPALFPSLLCAGNPPQHPGLVHAALPKHTLAAGGALCARGGSDVVPLRPIQVSALWATRDLGGTGTCSWELSLGPLLGHNLGALWGLSQGLNPPALPHQGLRLLAPVAA